MVLSCVTVNAAVEFNVASGVVPELAVVSFVAETTSNGVVPAGSTVKMGVLAELN